MKIKKTRKSKRQRGTNTYGHGARKKWKGSGHRGGKGMAGSGKKADQKKSLVIKKYGNAYFGKQGITSKGTALKKLNVINLGQIQKNIDSLMKKFGSNNELVLKKYKVLGKGKEKLKIKLNIKALDISESAKRAIEKIGGKVVVLKKENFESRKPEKVKQEKSEKTEVKENKINKK